MTCNDNSTEYCGGSNRLNVYQLGSTANSTSTSTTSSTATTAPPTSGSTTVVATSTSSSTSSSSPTPTGPSVNPGLDGYSSIGCYTEATNARALANFMDTTNKTVADCIEACKANSYIYAGLEYGGECWCDNSFANGSIPAPIGDCGMTCNGNSTEFCGGPNRLNVYQLKKTPSTSSAAATTSSSSTGSSSTVPSTTVPPTTVSSTTSSSTTTSAATPTGPAIKKVVNNYNFQGCWDEPPNDRAIIDQTYANDSMTLESCATFCNGFTYFGTEYGRECYCGNVLKQGAVKATNQADCSFPCAGDGTEYCGAGNRLELYMVSPNTTTVTTASASSASAALKSSSTSTTSGAASTSSAAASSSTAISTTSSGTATTSGASTSSGATATSSGAATTLRTSTSAATSASPSPTGPVIFQGDKNYTYYGCVSEPSAGKLMDFQVYNNGTTMTPQVCLSQCEQFTYAGVEYGQECWCGNTLNLAGWSGATPGQNVSSSQCSMLCPGNATEYCGSGNVLQLYVRKTSVSKRWWKLI